LVDGTPEILQLAVDSKEDFVHMPVVAESALSSLQLADIICAELLTPPPVSLRVFQSSAVKSFFVSMAVGRFRLGRRLIISSQIVAETHRLALTHIAEGRSWRTQNECLGTPRSSEVRTRE
jgi:hypothetical protein